MRAHSVLKSDKHKSAAEQSSKQAEELQTEVCPILQCWRASTPTTRPPSPPPPPDPWHRHGLPAPLVLAPSAASHAKHRRARPRGTDPAPVAVQLDALKQRHKAAEAELAEATSAVQELEADYDALSGKYESHLASAEAAAREHKERIAQMTSASDAFEQEQMAVITKLRSENSTLALSHKRKMKEAQDDARAKEEAMEASIALLKQQLLDAEQQAEGPAGSDAADPSDAAHGRKASGQPRRQSDSASAVKAPATAEYRWVNFQARRLAVHMYADPSVDVASRGLTPCPLPRAPDCSLHRRVAPPQQDLASLLADEAGPENELQLLSTEELQGLVVDSKAQLQHMSRLQEDSENQLQRVTEQAMVWRRDRRISLTAPRTKPVCAPDFRAFGCRCSRMRSVGWSATHSENRLPTSSESCPPACPGTSLSRLRIRVKGRPGGNGVLGPSS